MTSTSSATDVPPTADGQSWATGAAAPAPTPPRASMLGPAFADALARNDYSELTSLLHPEIEFRALTPRRSWEPESRHAAIEVLRTWFGDCTIEEAWLDSDTFSDCCRVAYRFQGRRPAGPFVIEQQVYFNQCDGQINWMRIMCSGFRTP
jgi:hypothetical protein